MDGIIERRPGVFYKGNNITHICCQDCKHPYPPMFIVHDSLWNGLNLQGSICLSCFEDRLGRLITKDDLKDCRITEELRLGFIIFSRSTENIMPEKIKGREYVGTYYNEAALVSKEAIEAIHGLKTPLNTALAFQILPKYIRIALLEAHENPDRHVVVHLPTCAHRQQLRDVIEKYEITNLELI